MTTSSQTAPDVAAGGAGPPAAGSFAGEPPPAYHSLLDSLSYLVIAIGLIVILGWFTNQPALKAVLPGLTTMKFNTAVGLCLLAVGCICFHRRSRSLRIVGKIATAIVILTSAATLAEYIFSINLHFDQLIVADHQSVRFPGRNAPATCICFNLIAISLLLIDADLAISLAQALLAVTLVLPLATLGGYLYGTPGMWNNAPYPVIALNTAVGLVLLCIAGLFLNTRRGFMKLFVAKSPGGMVARRLIPLALCLPMCVGLVVLTGEKAGLYGRAFGSALSLTASATLFAAAVWWTASLLNRIEHSRVRAEAMARDYADRFREMADIMPLICWTAKADGTIDFFNREYYEFTGFAPGSVSEKGFEPILHPDDVAKWSRSWSSAVRTGRPYQIEQRFYDYKTHKHRWFLIDAMSVRSGVDKPLRWYGAATDIDDQKQAEESARLAMQDAEAANQAKDRFLAVLSHELRTPLTPVLAAISSLETNASLPPAVASDLAMIRRNIEMEARLIDDLLDMTRLGRGKFVIHPEVIDAHAAITRTIESLQTQLSLKQIELKQSLTATSFHVWFDPTRLQQVLMNLLQNAIKFAPDTGGQITLTTKNNDSQLEIAITDNGVGIDTAVLSRLFVPFEQGDYTVGRRFGGLGLGLAIVKAIVERHDGAITAASPGRNLGSTFTLQFATVPIPAPARPLPRVPDPTIPPGPQQKILYVEDHVDTRKTLTRLLKGMGYSVQAVGSVTEAMQISELEKFDLLISDLGLPDGTGHDIMRRLGTRMKGIAVSGFGQDEDLARSKEAGFEAHLTKPVSFQTLEHLIRDTIQKPNDHPH